jgi:hypothetical protein
MVSSFFCPQRQLEIDLGAGFAQAAFAWEILDVEEIGEFRRLLRLELRLVISDNVAEHDRSDRARRNAVRDEVLHRRRAVWCGRQAARINLLEQAFVASALRVGEFHVDDVPRHVAAFYLGFDLRDAAVVVDRVDLRAGLGFKRFMVGLDLALRIGAAP